MKRVKEFIKRYKGKIIIGCVVVGGILVCVITKRRRDNEGANELIKTWVFTELDGAIEQFKDFQKTNKTVGMFWENDTYSVLDLEAK
jgi:hypothetical protein